VSGQLNMNGADGCGTEAAAGARIGGADLRVLLVIAGALIGCGSPLPDDPAGDTPIARVPGAEQPGSSPTPSSSRPPAPVLAYQGTVATLGDCGVGVARVDSDFADFYTYAGGITQSSQRWVRQGQLLVACGVPHRLLGFVFEEAGTRAVVLDGNPVATVNVPAGAVVLTVDGVVNEVGPEKVTLKALSIAMQGPRPIARFRVALRDGREQGAIGGAGDSIEIASVPHRIIEVAPADAAAGIPGWVQIDGSPESTGIEIRRAMVEN
jgi:hypothetical protein